MMWHAETDQAGINRGTVLSVYQTPWRAGQPAPALPRGVNLAVHFTGGSTTTVAVVQVNAKDAVIQLSNQSKWRMEPSSLTEIALAAGTGGAWAGGRRR